MTTFRVVREGAGSDLLIQADRAVVPDNSPGTVHLLDNNGSIIAVVPIEKVDCISQDKQLTVDGF